MKKKLLIGGAIGATIAVAAFAQMSPHDSRPPGPKTRAEVQAMVADHFKAADTNKDGFVTKVEFTAARDAMKAKMDAMRAEHRGKMFAKLDKDGNGSLSKAEFDAPPPPGGHEGPGGPGPDGPRHGHRGRGGPMMYRGMMGGGFGGDRWFDRADANKDGKLTLAEASAGPLAMFDKADTNHDGTISSEERKAAFEAMRGRWKDRKAD